MAIRDHEDQCMYILRFCHGACEGIPAPDSEAYADCGDATCETCQRFTSLEKEIAETKAHYDSLVKEYREFKQTINQVHKSPVDRLPLEVISIIFEFFIVEKESRCPELALGAVCRNWRRIAWSTASLWTSLTFTFTPSTTAEKVGLAVEWLKRSGRLPVTIVLHTKYDSTNSLDSNLALAEPLLRAVSECSDRWSSISLRLPPSFISAIRDTSGPSPVLYGLSAEPTGSSASLHIPNSAPQSLYLAHIPLIDLSINWEKAANLVCSASYSVCECIRILKEAVSLIGCSFGPRTRGTLEFTMGMTTNNSLESLFFTALENPEDTAFFFDHITLPALLSLRLDLRGNDIPITSLSAFLQRSSTTLNSLSLINVDLPASSLNALAVSIPFISELSIHVEWSIDRDTLIPFYRAFEPRISCRRTSDSQFLPHLKSLSLSGQLDVPEELIASLFIHYNSHDEVATSKCRPLESVSIFCRAMKTAGDDAPLVYITKPALDQVEFLEKKGLQVSVEDYSGFDLVKESRDRSVLGGKS